MSTHGRALSEIQRIQNFEKKSEKKIVLVKLKKKKKPKRAIVYFNVLNVLLSSNLHHSLK